MKNTSDNLHELIHCMSMNEKRYFKITTSGNRDGQDNTYLKLFNLIAEQKKYNEHAIKSSLSAQAKKDLPVMKNYLYNLILKKLCSYNASSQIEIQLHNQLSEAFILFQKGLYKHYEKKLKKIKAVAKKYNKTEVLLEIYNRELKQIHFKENLQAMEDKYEILLRESAEILNRINNRNQYYRLKNKMYLLLRKTGVSQNKQTQSQYSQLMLDPLLKNENAALTPESRLCYYDLRASYHLFGRSNSEKAIDSLEAKHQFLQQLPERSHEYIISLANTLINLAISNHSINKIKRAFEIIMQLEEEMEKWKKTLPAYLYSRILSSLHSIKSSCLIDIGNFKEGLQEILHEEELLHMHYSSNNFNGLYYKKAVAHFALNQYPESLSCINTLLNSSTLIEQDKYYRKTKLLQLLLYIEMQKSDLIEHEAIAIKRFYKKAGNLSKAEKMAFDFIINSLNADLSQKQFIVRCITFKKQLDSIVKDPHEKGVIDGFDILTWLESKIQNRSLTEIVQEKAKLSAK
ncbi:MAG: hypothetical protein JNL63_08850 [Bacteroidia bacterium]|nr:hypothetical protein [Bacteroidia bacterium]